MASTRPTLPRLAASTQPTKVPKWVRRLCLVFVVALFCGLHSLGTASAKNDPSGLDAGTRPTAICSELGGEIDAKSGECTGIKTESIPNAIEKNRVAVNLTWLMVAGALVFFMQAGFAMVETGFCRAKNAAHVVATNYLVFGLGVLGFALIGFPLMFGSYAATPIIGMRSLGSPLIQIGGYQFLSWGGSFVMGRAYDAAIVAFFFFQVVFMDTMVTIPTGAMAERWKFTAFAVFGFVGGAFIYPIIGNWVWGGGWLSQLGANAGLGHGAVDFAGSGVVHAVGGVTGLMGAIVLGPRLGKYTKDGKPNALPAHNIPMGIFGTIILFFGWIGFNGGSTFAASDFRFPVVIVNTILAGSAGMVAAMFVLYAWKKRFGKPDPSMLANGGLAGLVAITAPCAFTSPMWSIVIGTIAGLIVVPAIVMIEARRVDDPVGAVAVHGICGLWGVLAVGIFADGTYGDGLNGVKGGVKGLLFGDVNQFLAQVIYAVVVVVVIGAITFAFFKIQDKVQGIRSAEADEIAGLDVPEMGVEAYADGEEPSIFGGPSAGAGVLTDA